MIKTIAQKMAAVILVVLLPTMVFAKKQTDDAQKARILNKTYLMQIPFIGLCLELLPVFSVG